VLAVGKALQFKKAAVDEVEKQLGLLIFLG